MYDIQMEDILSKSFNSYTWFNAMIDDIQMEDIGYKGQMHTWSNNRRGVERILERLDRVLGNRLWCSNYLKPNASMNWQ